MESRPVNPFLALISFHKNPISKTRASSGKIFIARKKMSGKNYGRNSWSLSGTNSVKNSEMKFETNSLANSGTNFGMNLSGSNFVKNSKLKFETNFVANSGMNFGTNFGMISGMNSGKNLMLNQEGSLMPDSMPSLFKLIL